MMLMMMMMMMMMMGVLMVIVVGDVGVAAACNRQAYCLDNIKQAARGHASRNQSTQQIEIQYSVWANCKS